MIPLINILPQPLAHGAVGFWDEVLNLAPLVIGGGVLIYLYIGARRRRAAAAQQREASVDQPTPPGEHPQP